MTTTMSSASTTHTTTDTTTGTTFRGVGPVVLVVSVDEAVNGNSRVAEHSPLHVLLVIVPIEKGKH